METPAGETTGVLRSRLSDARAVDRSVASARPIAVARESVRSGRAAALVCGVAALVVSLVAVLTIIAPRGGQLSALVRMSSGDAVAVLAREADPHFAFVPRGSHYDGTYFYAVALDPLALAHAHTLLDSSAYRYGHPGMGWLAWALSFNNPALIPLALALLGLAGAVVAGVAISLLARDLGWSPWAGLAAALSPGIILAVSVDTAEAVGVALAAVAVLLWLRGRIRWAAVFLIGAVFMKETFLLVPVALALWTGIDARRGRRADGLAKRAVCLAAAPVLFALWYVYLRLHFGVWPNSETADFSAPITGWVDTFNAASVMISADASAAQIGAVMVPMLALLAGAMVLGITRARLLRSPLDVLFLLFACVVASLNWWTLLYPKDLVRVLVVPLLLLPAVLSHPRAQEASAPPVSRR